ncbi:hypothetical protein R0G64_31665, partial [Pseudomonas otitidis]|nr:hypothetical protein [Pseudomonas otitidis]
KVLFITGYAQNAPFGNEPLPPGMEVMAKPYAIDALAILIRPPFELPKELHAEVLREEAFVLVVPRGLEGD